MRKLTASAGTAIALAALLVGPASPASADDGDGDNYCDYTEICFRYGSASGFSVDGNMMKTFWYGNMHHENEWLLTDYIEGASAILMDNATGFWNRDSSCRVKLWDVDGSGTWYVYADLPRDFRGDVGYRINNGHSRC